MNRLLWGCSVLHNGLTHHRLHTSLLDLFSLNPNQYTAIEASPEFLEGLKKKNIKAVSLNLNEGITLNNVYADIAVMIISLSQFKETSAHNLLEDFKKISKSVVIVEEVLPKKRGEHSLVEKTIHYLSATSYYRPVQMFTAGEFEDVMKQHHYKFKQYNHRYAVGFYNQDS